VRHTMLKIPPQLRYTHERSSVAPLTYSACFQRSCRLHPMVEHHKHMPHGGTSSKTLPVRPSHDLPVLRDEPGIDHLSHLPPYALVYPSHTRIGSKRGGGTSCFFLSQAPCREICDGGEDMKSRVTREKRRQKVFLDAGRGCLPRPFYLPYNVPSSPVPYPKDIGGVGQRHAYLRE
jgi:hypothetical protein